MSTNVEYLESLTFTWMISYSICNNDFLCGFMQAWKFFHEGIAITNLMDQKLQLHNDMEVAQMAQVANIALLC
jgi:hypothetical protein